LSYILKVGLMFGDKQYEEGDIIEDVPTKSVKWLKKQGLIEEVKGLEQAEALQKKRARNSKGHFIADDPTTEKNEAYEEQE
tara:strand:+ start:521 stop:763 length:243 start_codon:yes stop_codon:yes gene_type:complete